MNEEVEENGALPAVIDATVSVLPEGWKTKAAKFLLRTIGVRAAPAFTQQVGDELNTLAGRKLVSQAMAQAVATRLASDPQQVERAIDRFYGDFVERQQNLESVAHKAAEEIHKVADGEEPTEEVSTDWRRKFADYASDVSDPDLQLVWAKLLAGEFARPGSFSFRTLRLVSEMDASVAGVFAELGRERIADNAIPAIGDEWHSGTLFRDSKILEDWGLIHEVAGATSRFVPKDEKGRYFIWGSRFAAMVHCPTGPDKVMFPIMQLTQAGRELVSLLPANDERPVVERIVETLRPELSASPVAIIGTHKQLPNGRAIEPFEFIWGDASALSQI